METEIFKYLDSIVIFNTKMKLSRIVILYHDTDSVKKIMSLLNNTSPTSITYTFPAMPKSPVDVECHIRYAGFDFIVLNMDKFPSKLTQEEIINITKEHNQSL